jgi:hypothetical protein
LLLSISGNRAVATATATLTRQEGAIFQALSFERDFKAIDVTKIRKTMKLFCIPVTIYTTGHERAGVKQVKEINKTWQGI